MFPIKKMCKVLEIRGSAYYEWIMAVMNQPNTQELIFHYDRIVLKRNEREADLAMENIKSTMEG